ncbi:hypothetical protein [Methylobacterium nigriterrae]|uniref:hypothetical protein n=1 Tax=Methylobacterium nigriterrae TaxID=3127512 RepID=UPI00301340CA
MTADKPRPLGPAPEPKLRPDPEAMKRLMAEASELGGFTRPSGASDAGLPNLGEVVQVKAENGPAKPSRRRSEPPRDHSAPKGGVLKCDVGDELFEELRVAAVRRRVTVKYLLVEALAAQGYRHADLNSVPKDGRRDR